MFVVAFNFSSYSLLPSQAHTLRFFHTGSTTEWPLLRAALYKLKAMKQFNIELKTPTKFLNGPEIMRILRCLSHSCQISVVAFNFSSYSLLKPILSILFTLGSLLNGRCSEH